MVKFNNITWRLNIDTYKSVEDINRSFTDSFLRYTTPKETAFDGFIHDIKNSVRSELHV